MFIRKKHENLFPFLIQIHFFKFQAERKAGEDVHAFDWTQSMKRQIYFFEKEEIVKNK
jgi:hypothetical protein